MPKRRKNAAIDAVAELERIRALRRLSDQRRKYTSKLDRYRQEILELRGAGASAADIRLWLKGQRIAAAESTVRRWLHVQLERTARRAAGAAAAPSHLLPLDLFEGGGDDGERQP